MRLNVHTALSVWPSRALVLMAVLGMHMAGLWAVRQHLNQKPFNRQPEANVVLAEILTERPPGASSSTPPVPGALEASLKQERSTLRQPSEPRGQEPPLPPRAAEPSAPPSPPAQRPAPLVQEPKPVASPPQSEIPGPAGAPNTPGQAVNPTLEPAIHASTATQRRTEPGSTAMAGPVSAGTAPSRPGALNPASAVGSPAERIDLPYTDAQHRDHSKPAYPALSKRLGEQGRVVVNVLIGPDGTAQRVELLQSSGFDRLDQSALATALRWRYVPGKKGGVPQTMWFGVPITFVIE